ncbi:MAG: NAD(P)/FAD-dependent oxidoreductase [Alphaproteobacteria bacterium]
MVLDVAVIGGGVAGLSIAAGLVRDGRKLTVLEAEAAAGYHASGRSAATLSMIYGNDLIVRLTADGVDFFLDPPPEFSEHELLKVRGRMVIAREDQREALLEKYEGLRGDSVFLEGDDVLSDYPFFRPGYVDCAIVDIRGGDLDTNEILMGYARQVRAGGGEIRFNFRVAEIRREGGVWEIRPETGDAVRAKMIVNAAGAWADEVARLAGLPPLGLAPKRRTACIVPPAEGLDVEDMPFVIDLDEEFYFRPEAGNILLSPADETPSAPTDAQPEEIDIAIAVDRFEKATTLTVPRVLHKWSGLRTFAPDRVPVVGFDPLAQNFFWYAGQGGYGFQIAPGLQRFGTALVNGKGVPADLKAALSPGRLR